MKFNSEFKLSQSALKSFENEDSCLEDFKKVFVTKTSSFPSNPKMDYGSYFEYLAIGRGAGHQDVIKDLPRKKNGDKTVAQERIETQADRFKEMLSFSSDEYTWFEIEEIQKYISSNNQTGVIDIKAVEVFDRMPILVDLKLTSDVNATHHPAMFGHDKDIDITQAVHYCYLYEIIYGVRPIFMYYVFDYSPRMGFKKITVEVSNLDIKGLNERKNKLFNFVYNHNPEEDWSKYCKCNECSKS